MATIARPTVIFDQYSDDYAAHWREIVRQLQRETPVAWTEAHGGYWIVTKYDDIVRIESDPPTFSADNDPEGERNGAQGIRIPRNRIRFRLNEADPPEHTALRALEAPAVSPKAIQRWSAETQRLADAHIDAFIESGHCNIVEDLAIPVPAKVTLQILGVPLETWRDYLAGAQNNFLAPDHPDFPHAARLRIVETLSQLMEERRKVPADDVITALTHASVNGQPLPKEDALGMLQSLAYGGFDTTAATICNCLYYLQDHPEYHTRLIADPKYLAAAVEEMLRAFTPFLGGLARTVMQDTEIRGQLLRKGERVLMLYNAANLDPDIFPDPDRIDFDRPNARKSLAFGSGNHRCLGSMLGQREVQIVVRTVLQRMPDYRIDKAKAVRFPKAGAVNGWLSMPATFTPGARLA